MGVIQNYNGIYYIEVGDLWLLILSFYVIGMGGVDVLILILMFNFVDVIVIEDEVSNVLFCINDID